MTTGFPRGDRTYYVSDERLRAFRQLTPEQKLRWVEELATFLRMAKISREKRQDILKRSPADADE
jgi:fido (protein-threonine AMPylation protein)